jgi:hypothetical protein
MTALCRLPNAKWQIEIPCCRLRGLLSRGNEVIWVSGIDERLQQTAGMAKHKTMRVPARHKIHLSTQGGVTPVSSYIAGGWTPGQASWVSLKNAKNNAKVAETPMQ